MPKRITDSEFRKRVKQKQRDRFEILSDYHGIMKKVEVRCNKCNWHGEVLAAHLMRRNYGSKCPVHDHRRRDSSSFQKAINEKQDNQYTLLSKFVNLTTKVKIKCNICKKEINVWPSTLLYERIGKNCNHKIILNFEQASKRLNKISNGEIKLVHFSGMHSVATFEHHTCGNFWKTIATSVFNNSEGCPFCSSSKGEKAVTKYLKENKILFKSQFTFPNCQDRRKLPFDFAVFNRDGSLNSLIEYQGCQHFMDPSQFKKGDFYSKKSILSTQKHDKMKSTFCQEHGIQLIHIDHPQIASKFDKPSFIANLVKRTLDKELKVN